MEQIHYLYRRKKKSARSEERSWGLKRPAHLFRQNECTTLDEISQSTEECKTLCGLNSKQE